MKTGWSNGLVLLLLVMLFGSCGPGKERVSDEQREMVREIIEGRAFEFKALWAIPISGQDMTLLMNAGLLRPGDAPNRINLTGNPNYVRIHGDSISGYLPFFGEQQMNVSLNPADQAIQFDEVARDLQVKYIDQKDRYEIRFSASRGTQGYILFLTVFPNMTANLRVNSSSRDFIAYEGNISRLPSPDEQP